MNVLHRDIVGRICDFSVYGCEMRGHRLMCGGLCYMTLVELYIVCGPCIACKPQTVATTNPK